MPFRLAEHVDRSAEKKLLRGQSCFLISWVVESPEPCEESGLVVEDDVAHNGPVCCL